jgi:alpha-galactosidase
MKLQNLYFRIPGMTIIMLALILHCCRPTSEQSDSQTDQGIMAETPPMGWNSWNCLGIEVTEEQVKAVADYMADHLKEYGWEYVVVDAGWYHPPTFTTPEWNDHQTPPQLIDEYGRLIPDPVKFPSSIGGKGFKPLADYVHSKGLKFGIHIMRGVPWNAAEENKPIKGTSYTAADIADKENRCEWAKMMYGINTVHPAADAYYQSIIELYSSWGVDYIKADDMSRPYRTGEVEALWKAASLADRDIVISLSPGAAPLESADNLKANANLWRISNDFWDSWTLLKKQFEYCRKWAPHIAPGHWPDADMLALGKLRKSGVGEWEAGFHNLPPDKVKDEYSRFTPDEQFTHMNLWAIFRSPMMMGGYLPENDEFTLKLLTNKDLIRINQHSKNNREIAYTENWSVWVADDEATGDTYLALFNTGEEIREVSATLGDLGLTEVKEIKDIWTGEVISSENERISVSLKPHASVMLKIK